MKFPSYRYFKNVYKHQRPYIKSVIDRLDLKGKKMVSIGSGTGAEEILFAEEGLKIVDCIEPDIKGCLITAKEVKKRNFDSVFPFHKTHERFTSSHRYDLIYTSSPSDWMHKHIWHDGMPLGYVNFIKRFSADKCFFIVVVYGGTFHGRFIPGNTLTADNIFKFLDIITKQCNEIGWHLLECWEGWANAYSCLLVLSNNFIRLSDDATFENCFRRWSTTHECRRVHVNEGN